MDERKQRQEERQELEGERQQIAQIRRNIDQQKYDLEVRENKLIELEPFIPLAKQLQAMKIDITNFLPWVETVHEYAVTRNTDLTTAAYNIADALRQDRQLGSLHKTVEKAEQQLSALNIVIEQRQRAITSLVDFQSKGISDTELIELNKLINSWGGWSQEQNNNGVNTVKRLARLDDKLHIPIN